MANGNNFSLNEIFGVDSVEDLNKLNHPRYGSYNTYLAENPTVEDTEALLALELLNYYEDAGRHRVLTQLGGPEQLYEYENVDSLSVVNLVDQLQEMGSRPYIYMGGDKAQQSIGTYQTGKPGYRAEFREDKNQYINEVTGNKLSRRQYSQVKDDRKWLDYLKENENDPKYKKWLDEYAYDKNPAVLDFDSIRPLTKEEKLAPVVINSPYTERKRREHPLDSYIAELAHAYQFDYGEADREYIDYLNSRVFDEHNRWGDHG